TGAGQLEEASAVEGEAAGVRGAARKAGLAVEVEQLVERGSVGPAGRTGKAGGAAEGAEERRAGAGGGAGGHPGAGRVDRAAASAACGRTIRRPPFPSNPTRLLRSSVHAAELRQDAV